MRLLAGNLIMTGLPGLSLDSSTRQLIKEHGVNHFIIFRRNVESPGQLTRLCADIIDCCQEHGLLEPLIAIDQEGGTVARLPPPFSQFADAREYGDHPQAMEKMVSFARQCAADLRGCGINLNFAPVLDVCPRHQGCFMEQRALGADPQRVARLGAVVIEILQQEGVAACGKHFPGLGSGVIDPHRQLPTVDKDVAAIHEVDLPPFQAAISAGVAAIMTSHVLYSALDPDNLATMSKVILTDLLRSACNYSGLIVTDDLEMGAIENDYAVAEAAWRAVKAGADLLLICHDHNKVRQTIVRLQDGLAAGTLSVARVGAAAERLRQLSGAYGRGKS